MWRMMTVGQAPFVLDDKKELCFRLAPKIPGWLFTEEEKEVSMYTEEGERIFVQSANSFAFHLPGDILGIYYNDGRMDTYSQEAKVREIRLYSGGQLVKAVEGDTVQEPYAGRIRERIYDKIEAVE